mgnify:CR=1 FL=1
MFDVNKFLNELVVSEDDMDLKTANDTVEICELGCDDAWLARQEHYGAAGAMERQIEFLGNSMIPNAESRITRMASGGVSGESYQFNSFTGFSNEEDQHINDEVDNEHLLDEQRKFRDQLVYRQRKAGIRMITRVIAHDKLSKTLDQLSYGGIKKKAAHNKKDREDAAVNQQLKEQYAKTA